MPRLHVLAATLVLCLAVVRPAAAQMDGWTNKQYQAEILPDGNTLRLTGQVEVEGAPGTPNEGQRLSADEVLWNLQTGEFEATGNVVLATVDSRLSADHVTFNTKTRLGTFYTASGIAALGERGQEDASMFGAIEPDVYFYGDVIEKIGEDKYRITRGGFTTCVQPTPRWEVVSSTSTINLGDYAVLRNAVMRVKDVPVFYLPVLYYPIQDDKRATGFLMPTYGNSTIQGQSISNAFFWAIDRSQDLTLLHDWYFSRGQGYGTEYRYAAGPASNGEIRFYRLATEQSIIQDNITNPARRSYEVRGSLAQVLPLGLRARGRVDYFSDITTQQLYNQGLYAASLSQRLVNGSVSGAWGGVSLSGNYQRSEQFFSTTNSVVNGYEPSLQAAVSSRKIGPLPVYFALTGEAARVLYATRRGEGASLVEDDRSLGRVDFNPQLRAPLTNLPFLSVNTTLGYRYTYYTESLDEDRQQVPVGLTRSYAEMAAEVLGPVFTKVYSPGGPGGTRLKHIIEPTLSVERTTSIENREQIVQLGNIYDSVIGGVTRYSYGLTNRVLVRGAAPPGTPAAQNAAPRELLTIGVVQSYYSDELASVYDQDYQSSYGLRQPSKFSPVAFTARTAPTRLTSATVRVEYDHEERRIQGLSAQGRVGYPNAQVSVGWSRRRFSETLTDHTLNSSTTVKFADGRAGGTYAFDWDIGRSTILQQRWIGFYNAQCCGFTIEYQEYNYPETFLIPKNRRFNFGFTLAGVGTFSNFFGAFGGQTTP